ncbi:MAG: GIY-YIG nuclease family protein [Clostridia bacterium]|nr:GIY-YIG nuclease family protein [Clostridia bacterium]
MKHFAYMLRCDDHTIYSGYTNNLSNRIAAHNSGKGAKYTSARLPVRLIYYEEFNTKSEAMKREAQFKKLSRAEKEKLVSSFNSHLLNIDL